LVGAEPKPVELIEVVGSPTKLEMNNPPSRGMTGFTVNSSTNYFHVSLTSTFGIWMDISEAFVLDTNEVYHFTFAKNKPFDTVWPPGLVITGRREVLPRNRPAPGVYYEIWPDELIKVELRKAIYDPALCEIHQTRMRPMSVPINYGRYSFPDEPFYSLQPEEFELKTFPHRRRTSTGGGDVGIIRQTRVIFFCSECENAFQKHIKTRPAESPGK
jgi:hypothetical protein